MSYLDRIFELENQPSEAELLQRKWVYHKLKRLWEERGEVTGYDENGLPDASKVIRFRKQLEHILPITTGAVFKDIERAIVNLQELETKIHDALDKIHDALDKIHDALIDEEK